MDSLKAKFQGLPSVVKVGCVGALSSVLDVAVLLLLLRQQWLGVALCAFFGAMAGASINFLLNKYWSFKSSAPIRFGELFRFAQVAVATACLMGIGVHVLVVGIGFSALSAKVLTAALVFVFWSYPAQRRYVFVSHS